MKRVNAPSAWSSNSDLGKKLSDGRDPPPYLTLTTDALADQSVGERCVFPSKRNFLMAEADRRERRKREAQAGDSEIYPPRNFPEKVVSLDFLASRKAR